MSTLLSTLSLAIIVVALAVALMAIGWLITGKSKLKACACGRDPTKKKDKECDKETIKCSVCSKDHQSTIEITRNNDPTSRKK